MTEAEATALTAEQEAALAGVNIDPATWEEPKITFPGVVIVSTYVLAQENYVKENKFRRAITEPWPQWDFRVERLDAIRVETDGSQGPSIFYGGIDLRKYNQEADALVPISSRNGKEFFVTNEHKKVFGTTHPPEVLIGRKAMFEYYQVKTINGWPYNKVLVPTEVLAPDYEFTGEKRLIKAREKTEDDGGNNVGSEDAIQSTVETLSEEEAIVAVVQALDGLDTNDSSAIGTLIADLPGEVRVGAVVSKLATGQFVTEQLEAGTLTKDANGKLAAS